MSNLIARFGSLALFSVIFLGACTTKQEVARTLPPPAAPPAHMASKTGPEAPSVLPGSPQDFRVNVGDTVHFAYDKYLVQENDKPTLQRQAMWLQKYPSVRVILEGHCDERGTREYNLALGARRANAVKEYFVASGVSSARIETVSMAKNARSRTESSESCWSQNRRGVTTITAGAASPLQASNDRWIVDVIWLA